MFAGNMFMDASLAFHGISLRHLPQVLLEGGAGRMQPAGLADYFPKLCQNLIGHGLGTLMDIDPVGDPLDSG